MRVGAASARTVALAALLSLAGCSVVDNSPINVAVEQDAQASNQSATLISGDTSDTVIGLAFSGGGTRAAAFSFGVLRGLAETNVMIGGRPSSLIDRVDFVSGVSGGSVTAAYFGLKGRNALADFRERFLIRNAEESMFTSVANPTAVVRALAGGANDRSNLPVWLDRNLFDGATYGQLLARKRPTTWLNASDINNHSPFVFEPNTFRAFCSDLSRLPISEAVAASAAVPVVFAPITLEAYPDRCRYNFPSWVRYADEQPTAPALLRSYARALKNYRDPEKQRFVRLLDGGLTDNFGLSGITIARAAAETPYAPLTPKQAVQIKAALFLVVNAGQATDDSWARSAQGPSIAPLLMAVVNTGINASVRQGYDAFQMTVTRWEQDVIEWRCKLPMSEVAKLRGTTAGWNCKDVKFHIGQVAFDQLPDRRARLEKIETRFQLPVDEVDQLIAAGRDVVLQSPVVSGFLSAFDNGRGRASPAGAQKMQRSQ